MDSMIAKARSRLNGEAVGPLLHQRLIDIDDRGQTHDVADLLAAAVRPDSRSRRETRGDAARRRASPGGKPPCASSASWPRRGCWRSLPISSTVSLPCLSRSSPGNERLADIMQQRGAHQAPLIVLAHAEMHPEGHREAGDVEAVTVGIDMVAADGGQPFAQRRVLDGLENLFFGADDSHPSSAARRRAAARRSSPSPHARRRRPRLSILPRSVAS